MVWEGTRRGSVYDGNAPTWLGGELMNADFVANIDDHEVCAA
jgi:hypothetical protein